jgi:hypothetical protein
MATSITNSKRVQPKTKATSFANQQIGEGASVANTTWQVITLLLLSGLFFPVFWGCGTHPEAAERVLQKAGYTMIDTDGFDFYTGCVAGETATPFSAIAPSGLETEGWVCLDEQKSYTVRIR